jgi:epoxide hydrolase-like predicted phosphatase
LKAIVFDFGNVVAFFDHFKTLDRLAAHTHQTPEQMYRAYIATDLEDAYDSGRITTAEFLERFRAACGLRCDDAVAAAAITDIFEPNRDVCELVPLLRPRYRVLLGSNTNELHSRHFRRQFADVFAHFDALVLSHEVGLRKPRAGFYEHCHRLAGCAPGECVFVDDLPANVEAAREYGLRGVVYRRGDDIRRLLAEAGVSVEGARPGAPGRRD